MTFRFDKISQRKALLAGVCGALLAAGGAVWLFSSGSSESDVSEKSVATESARPGSGTGFSTSSTSVFHGDSLPDVDSLSSDDFAGAWDAAMAMNDRGARTAYLSKLFTRWMNEDIGAFTAQLDRMEFLDVEDGALWANIRAAMSEAFTRLNADAASHPGMVELMRRLVSAHAAEDPAGALAWANEWLVEDAREIAVVTLMRDLARTDSEQALETLASLTSPLRRIESLDALGAGWAETNPEAAGEWAGSISDLTGRAYATGGVVMTMSETNAPEASLLLRRVALDMEAQYSAQRAADLAALGLTEADLLADPDNPPADVLPPLSGEVELLVNSGMAVAQTLSEEDPHRALAWVDSLSDPRMRVLFKDAVVIGWARTDPTAAYQHYRNHMEWNPQGIGDAQKTPPVEIIFEELASRDPNAAASEALRIQNPNERAAAVAGVMQSWLPATDDIHRVTAWVDALPRGFDRDRANAELVAHVVEEDPALAWSRSLEIEDPRLRVQYTRTAFSTLLVRDTARAKSALASAKLDEQDHNRFQRMLENLGYQ